MLTTTHLTMMTTSMTTRLHDNTNHKGLALCGHIILPGCDCTLVGPDQYPRCTSAVKVREAMGSPKAPHATKSRRKTQLLFMVAQQLRRNRRSQDTLVRVMKSLKSYRCRLVRQQKHDGEGRKPIRCLALQQWRSPESLRRTLD